ncbi:DM13 domain-containing protein [Pinisolibacter aquiterrae]|uniref:DM13 domain-containing protein n=1 Tax=Pinisolibacter aquiterrae TaxID=2815579 RepID=UPI001C3D440F|nr:DM13 domain-containing protein [Pinisolibacter aquiterrae]MBV5263335.1 DM13 domain-containing protein [Pinisolibacter aquiterrae]MCC8237587.1 DM13 domain-containing protein [Pinisolibacter aquiterrae]
MRLPRLATAAVLAATVAGLLFHPAFAQDEPPAPVPGPLRPLAPVVSDPQGTPATPPKRPLAQRRDPTPPQAVRTWRGALAPRASGELARGRVVLDVVTHQVRIDDFAVTDSPGLEIALVAGDPPKTNADVLAAKRVSLGRLRRIRATVILRFPAELDPAVYRTLVVWSRRDRAPRGLARLTPSRAG